MRPAGEVLLLFVDRWFRTGTRPADVPGALWQPIEAARISGGIPAGAGGDVIAALAMNRRRVMALLESSGP